MAGSCIFKGAHIYHPPTWSALLRVEESWARMAATKFSSPEPQASTKGLCLHLKYRVYLTENLSHTKSRIGNAELLGLRLDKGHFALSGLMWHSVTK